MGVFGRIRGGIRKPTGLKVKSGHVALCAITIAKLMFSQNVTFSANLYKSRPQGRLKVTFGWHLGRILHHVANCLFSFGAFWAHLGAHCGFSGISWGRVSPRSLPAAQAQHLWGDGKTALGPPGRGFYPRNTHIQQSCGMCPS